MRIRVLSDLHLEFRKWKPPQTEADIVVLAGDIHVGADGMKWAREQFAGLPVIHVPGNHEFYGGHLEKVLGTLRASGSERSIHLLDADEIMLDGTRFLGATLWTDFALHGSEAPQVERAMDDAKRGMNDFRLIRYGAQGLFRPEHARQIHLAQVKWLEHKFSEPFDGPTVVITHYLPHRQSIHPRYEGDRLNPCFASDLAHLVRPPVTLWIHGHTHESAGYVVNGTRVVCNPRGYLPMQPNRAFLPELAVDVPAT